MLFAKLAATFVPSAFQQTSNIPPCPLYVLTSEPSFTFQICKHLSNEPEARNWPLGEKATE